MPAGVVGQLTGGHPQPTGYPQAEPVIAAQQQQQSDPLGAIRGAQTLEEMAQAIMQVPELIMLVMQMMQQMRQQQPQPEMMG